MAPEAAETQQPGRWHWAWIPLAVFGALIIQGATLGLTDDEAYYWVLAQRPALGYAFHPPGVAWSIAFFQGALGWLFGSHTEGLTRLPAALYAGGMVALGLLWLRDAGAPEGRMGRGAAALLSFAGLFAAAWMIVPDLPLLFGWMLAFTFTWRICFLRGGWGACAAAGAGVALALLSKYSGVLVAGSAGLAVLLWAPDARTRTRGVLAIVLGAALAAAPVLFWNFRHDWASILYQVRDRHGGAAFSGMRYLRFWGIEAVMAGPALIGYAWMSFFRARVDVSAGGGSAGAGRSDAVADRAVSRYVLVWALPAAAVYCVQPAWSDFKPHWAFVVWLPFALELGLAWARGRSVGWARVQVAYGLPLLAAALLFCQFPVISWVTAFAKGQPADPRWDVSNDMFGWGQLPDLLRDQDRLPVVGARYQTASQAAFALGDVSRVSLIPRDAKQDAEWPDFRVADSGSDRARLLTPVFFVSDNRYTVEPRFTGARCGILKKGEARRLGVTAKWIFVWRCDP